MEPLKPSDESYLISHGIARDDIREYNRLIAKQHALDPDEPANQRLLTDLEARIQDLYKRIHHDLVVK